jgi:hypothetical protein
MPKSETLSINYDPKDADLKAIIRQLADIEGSRYEGRSLSEIGRIGITEWLKQETERLSVALYR